MITQTLYDTFNARYLTYQEVADSFVMTSGHFEKLIKNNHTLLMGPRGCGKTTFLKMLTLPALSRWDENNNSNLKSSIPFYTIYIPTDIQWKRQLDELKLEFPTEIKFTNAISSASVTINILFSLCKTFTFIISDLSQKSETNFIEKEIAFSKLLIKCWKLKGVIIPSIASIKSYLLEIISDLNAKVNKAIFLKTTFEDLDELLFYEFIELVRNACDLFESVFNISNEKRWALCFDELEIAPDWLQYKLLEYLRSSDQKILFKLTTAPIISLYKEIHGKFVINASENNDYNVIQMWISNHRELTGWYEFCEEISRRRIIKKFTNKKLLVEITGRSDLDFAIIDSNSLPETEVKKDLYGSGSPTWFLFKQLAIIDRSFRNFLIRKTINPDNPIPKNIAQRNEVFRKMRQLAIYRFTFRKENSSRRSRKVVPLYYGTPLLYEICDGNPRFFIGLIDELLTTAEIGNGEARKLSINEQARIVTKISEKYISVLASYPGANVVIKNTDKNIKDLIDEIGDYFYNKLINDDFTIDPCNSFRVDQEINSKLVSLLELALYLGAIVYLEGKEAISEKGIIDKKFRLSYILSPYFRTLAREYSDIQLSSILRKSSKDTSQMSILDQNDN